MVIKMSKIAQLLYFLLMTANNQYSLGKTFKFFWTILFGSFRKGFLGSELPLASCQPLFMYFFADSEVILIFLPLISQEQ